MTDLFRCCVYAYVVFYVDMYLLITMIRNRQRYQWRLKKRGDHHTLNDEREELLDSVNFVWDTHVLGWNAHFQSLQVFQRKHGHCNATDEMEFQLSTWCKHQRRQYHRQMRGSKSTLTAERIQLLDSIGFDWNPRNLPRNQY